MTLSFESMRWAKRVTPEGLRRRTTKPTGCGLHWRCRLHRARSTGLAALASSQKRSPLLVAMNPKNGAILALIGGFDFKRSYL